MKTAKGVLLSVIFALLILPVTAAQTTVFVPGNASGYFGEPYDLFVPLVPAITVSGPATISVTYLSGTVDFGIGTQVGPNGGTYVPADYQLPLQEAKGIATHRTVYDIAALMGIFVPQSRTQLKGFTAVDATKNAATAGIMPDGLFFVGESKTITVKEAGTLFLGINDSGVIDNSRGFTVQVATSSAQR
jgi:hypothetical protein